MNKLSLSKKMYLMGGSFILGILFVGGIGIFSSRTLSGHLQSVISNDIPLIRNLTLIDMVHDGVRGAAMEAVLGLAQKSPEHIAEAEKTYLEHSKSVEQEFKEIHGLQLNSAEIEKLKAAEHGMKLYLESAKNVINSAKNGDVKASAEEFEKFQKEFEALEVSLGNFGDFIQTEKTAYFDEVLKDSEKLQFRTILVLLFSLLCGVTLFLLITRSLNKLLEQISAQLSDKSRKLFSSSDELLTVSTSMNETISKESAAIHQSATAMEEISSMVKKTDENANHLSQVAEQSSRAATEGQESFREIIREMNELKTVVTSR